MPRDASPGSVYTVSDASSEDFAPSDASSSADKPLKSSVKKRVRPTSSRKSAGAGVKRKRGETKTGALRDIEESAGPGLLRRHGASYHDVDGVAAVQEALLSWFEEVRDKRGMPWRKKYDPALSDAEKGQRAYEIWVSEIMLQQTQVATVIAYWKRWIEKWPTIADLAEADVEEVNAMWRGLGYYRRARSLLAGAKTVMGHAKYNGRLPSDPAVLEKEIDGVGRYTAGAICSMAYGVRTPIVDGNIHRLLTRLLAVHAPQTAPGTIKFLWRAAEDLVSRLPDEAGRKGIAGDWNQALMELGSQICKPVAPLCSACPIRSGCKALAEVSTPPTVPAFETGLCELCEPVPDAMGSSIPAVTVFPMRKEKKASREEEEVVCVTEWRKGDDRRWLFVKRPEKGLLAGLFEPPTKPITSSCAPAAQLAAGLQHVSSMLDISLPELQAKVISHESISSIPHIFSHINMIYHVQLLVLAPRADEMDPPWPKRGDDVRPAEWLSSVKVDEANVGTGVKKVWSAIYGSWGSTSRSKSLTGSFDVTKGGVTKERKVKPSAVKKSAKVVAETKDGPGLEGADEGRKKEKVVRKVMMPMMPDSARHKAAV